MVIYIDADAMPSVIRDILFRAAERTKTPVVLVSNMPLKYPASPLISSIVVPSGPDEADHKIAEMVQSGDLVITADIPLAGRAIAKGGTVIDPRGVVYSEINIKERLTMRNFMEELRNSGIDTGGPPPFTPKDAKSFADKLSGILSRKKTT